MIETRFGKLHLGSTGGKLGTLQKRKRDNIADKRTERRRSGNVEKSGDTA